MSQEIDEKPHLPHPTEFLAKIVKNIDRYEIIDPDQMGKTVAFWSSPLGERFTWAITNDRRKIMTCKHVSLSKPSIYLAHLFRPNKVDCVACGFKRLIRHNDENPDTCDGCQTEGLHEFHVVSYQAGMFIITGKICQTCYNKQPVQEDLEPKKEVQDEADDDQ